MFCVSVCFTNGRNHLCHEVNCWKIPNPINPFTESSGPLALQIDGKTPEWLPNVNAVALMANIASRATGETAKLLLDATHRAVEQLQHSLPEGMTISLHEH